jgi:RimJ/RimL family protein N-acetyltransferase
LIKNPPLCSRSSLSDAAETQGKKEKMKQIIETARLQLFPCKFENIWEIDALWTNPAVRRFLFDNRTISFDETRSFIAASAETFTDCGYGIWLIRGRENERLIGFAGLFKQAEAMPRLLYGLHPDCCKQGYAAEAARGVLEYAFDVLGFPLIAADVDEANAASVRVLRRLGMRETKREISVGGALLYFEMTRADYLLKKHRAQAA